MFALTERRVVTGFFVILVLTGLIAFRGYGVSWDEPTMADHGNQALNYVFGRGEWPISSGNRFHGPVFEMFLESGRQLLGIEDITGMFFFRHIVTFLLFTAGVGAFYVLGKRHFGEWRYALLGCALLVLHPRIFAHAFYNSRDIPNLAMFTVSIVTMLRMLQKRTVGSTLIHAFASAVTLGIRMTALLLPAFTALMIALTVFDAYRSGKDTHLREYILIFLLYIGALGCFTFALWPLLWEAPVVNFLEAYRLMSNFSRLVFYFGAMQMPPWHYIPVWIFITTPLLYTALFIVGCSSYIDHLRRPLTFLTKHRNEVLFALWLLLPIITVVIGGKGIYDEWRHVFFTYPAFVLIAVEGFRRLFALQLLRKVLVAIVSVMMIWIAGWMVYAHPLQGMYFSLPASWIEGKFELDYWGLSFRPGMEKILEMDQNPLVVMFPMASPGFYTPFTIREEDRKRIMIRSDNPTYILDNFRGQDYQKIFPPEWELFSIKVSGVTVLSVYKLPGAVPQDLQDAINRRAAGG